MPTIRTATWNINGVQKDMLKRFIGEAITNDVHIITLQEVSFEHAALLISDVTVSANYTSKLINREHFSKTPGDKSYAILFDKSYQVGEFEFIRPEVFKLGIESMRPPLATYVELPDQSLLQYYTWHNEAASSRPRELLTTLHTLLDADPYLPVTIIAGDLNVLEKDVERIFSNQWQALSDAYAPSAGRPPGGKDHIITNRDITEFSNIVTTNYYGDAHYPVIGDISW